MERNVDEIIKEEMNEIIRIKKKKDLGNVENESKKGLYKGYGKK
jgi:hypothetical protein